LFGTFSSEIGHFGLVVKKSVETNHMTVVYP
jgi:hypothetical protein